jgi:hypothetical protein
MKAVRLEFATISGVGTQSNGRLVGFMVRD